MHTEAIRPPRALWVPFEFGRPFGPPNRADVQMDVLRAALALFDRDRGPVLEDYNATEEDIAEASEVADAGWSCPLPQPPAAAPANVLEARKQALLAELRFLRPWYEARLRDGKRTAFGLSGLDHGSVEDIATYLVALAEGEEADVPAACTAAMPSALRFLAHDLKTFYIEAALARPADRLPTSRELDRWLFRETHLGDVFYDIRDRFSNVPEATRLLIPRDFTRRPGHEDSAP